MENFDLNNVKILIQDILNKEFPKVVEKRKIINRQKEFAFACPVCGDSNKTMSKKRGTLYFNSLRYRCWNCGCKTTLLGLLKKFDVNIEPHQKLEIVNYVAEATENIHFSEEEFITKDLDKLIDLDILTDWFNTNSKSPINNFRPIRKNSKVWKYLSERKIYDYENLYEGIYSYYDNTGKLLWNEDILINLNQYQGKVLGLQTRNLKSDKLKRRYRIFSFSELWEFLYPEIELDEIEAIGYNRLSYLYNILNVNWDYPITIFEGYLDTKFLDNSIGCVGTNTDINFILNQNADIRFLYDYDEAGIKKAKEMMRKGYSVFLWERMFDFWAAKTTNPSRAGRELRDKIKDLNDVAKLITNPYKKLEIPNWFSKDEFDMIYI